MSVEQQATKAPRRHPPAPSYYGGQALPSPRGARVPAAYRSDSISDTRAYSGYAERFGFDDDDGIFTARIASKRDSVEFHSDLVDGLRQAFHDAIEDCFKTCAKIGNEPQKTCSGGVMFRVSPGKPTADLPRWPDCPATV